MIFGLQKTPIQISHETSLGESPIGVFYLPSLGAPPLVRQSAKQVVIEKVKETFKEIFFEPEEVILPRVEPLREVVIPKESIPVEIAIKVFEDTLGVLVPVRIKRPKRTFWGGLRKILLTDVWVLARWVWIKARG